MKAKEMFEEIGYVLLEDRKCITYEISCDNSTYTLQFRNGNVWAFVSALGNKLIILSPSEIRAINKQFEELGWN